MASASSIGRLHAPVKNANLAHSIKPDREPVKSETVSDSEPDLLALFQQSLMTPLRRRFGSPRGALNSPAIMNSVPVGVPVDRSGAFANMAARDRAAVAMNAAAGRWRERQARTGAAEHQQRGLAIQV